MQCSIWLMMRLPQCLLKEIPDLKLPMKVVLNSCWIVSGSLNMKEKN